MECNIGVVGGVGVDPGRRLRCPAQAKHFINKKKQEKSFICLFSDSQFVWFFSKKVLNKTVKDLKK